MPNDYTKLSGKFSEKLKRIDTEIKYAERVGVKFPSSFTDYLKFVKSKYNEVVKKLADKDNKEALQKEIFDLWDHVFVGELKLRLLVPFYLVCAARESFKGDEDLARLHIKNYREHTENFLKIKKCVENDEQLPEHTVDSYRRQLRKFLKDLEIGRPEMVAKVNKEEEEKREKEKEKKEAERRFCISTILACVVIIIGVATLIATIIFGIIGLKGCGDSHQQPAQPEATVSGVEQQSATNNSALTT